MLALYKVATRRVLVERVSVVKETKAATLQQTPKHQRPVVAQVLQGWMQRWRRVVTTKLAVLD